MSEVLSHSIPFNFHMGLDSKTEVEIDSGSEDTKKLYLKGIASDTLPDKQNQKFSKGFLKTMINSADGMTCFYEHKRDLDNSIGFCKEATILEDALHVLIELESPETNELVKRLMQKSQQGIKIGLSVSGVVTKSSIEKTGDNSGDTSGDEIREAKTPPIMILEEGRLDEISAVGLPSNPRGWATVIMKSFNEGVQDMSDQELQKDAAPEVPLEAVAEKAEGDEPEEEASDEEAEEDVEISVSSAVISGVTQGVGGAIESLTSSQNALNEILEGTQKAVLDLAEKQEFAEKSQYDRTESIVRSAGEKLESNMRTHVDNTVRSAQDKQLDEINTLRKAVSDLTEKVNSLEDPIAYIKSDEFKDVLQQNATQAMVDGWESVQKNPSPGDILRKSQGNKAFNDVETHQQPAETRIYKNSEGELVVTEDSIDPLTLSEKEFEALSKEDRVNALNAGMSKLIGL